MIYVFANLLSISGITFSLIGLFQNEWRFFALGIFLYLAYNKIMEDHENE